MPDYRLRTRPIYGPDEVPLATQLGRGLGRGIGNAIDEYMDAKEVGRQERNTLAREGARRIPDNQPPGIPLGPEVHGLPTAPALPNVGTDVPNPFGLPGGVHVGTEGARPIPTAPQPTAVNNAAPAPALGGATTFGGAVDAHLGTTAPPSAPPRATPPGARPSGIGISDALAPYVYEAQGGARYQIDPAHAARAQFALQQSEGEQTYETQQQRQAAARAQDADLLRPRYGSDAELYAAHPELNPDKFAPSHSLTFGERQRLDAEKYAAQQDLARLRGQEQVAVARAKQTIQHGTTTEQRQALATLQRTYNDELMSLDRQAANDWALDPDDPQTRAMLDDRAAERTRIGQGLQQVEQALQGIGRPRGGSAGASPSRAPKPPITRDQYDYLTAPTPQGAGMTDAEVRARYTVEEHQ